jgi:Lipid membrane protein of large eukaryotic DNA viruses
MGASVSSNVIDMIARTVATVSTDIIQRSQLTTDSSQIISVADVEGDVYITGNTFEQTAMINVQALMTALNTESAQQRLMIQLSQEAKSLVSGLNIGQFAEADNTIDLLMEATIHLITTIKQTCAASTGQRQGITIVRQKGDVYVQGNIFSQVSNILYVCTQNAVSNSSEIQDLQAKLDQTASATAEGLSPWAIAIIVGIIFGVPVIGGVVGGYYVLKYIFPIVIVVGIVLIGMYFYWTTIDMQHVGFSTFVQNTALCLGQKASTTPQYLNVAQASDACLRDQACEAFDWQGIVVQPDGSYNLLAPATTTFYSSVAGGCQAAIRTDNVSTIRFPNFTAGAGEPHAIIGVQPGDAYLDTTTSKWYQLMLGRWLFMDLLMKTPYTRMTLGYAVPTAIGAAGDVYVFYDHTTPTFVQLYEWKADTKSWVATAKLNGPGVAPDAPTVTNASGFKVLNRKSALLYIGIAAIVIGAVGTFFVFFRTSKKKTEPGAARGGVAR